MFYLYDDLFDIDTRKAVSVVDVYPHGFKTRDAEGNTEVHEYETIRFIKV